MSATSSIEWTDRTWNPVRGCSVISPGCHQCYAMKQAHRFSGPGGAYEGLTKLTERSGPQWTGEVRLVEDHLTDPLTWRKPVKVFVNSMSDLFHESVPDEWIDRIFAVMALAPSHTFQVLTKRADRMRAYMTAITDNDDWEDRIQSAMGQLLDGEWVWNDGKHLRGRIERGMAAATGLDVTEDGDEEFVDQLAWPLKNVWLGVSVENQKYADERIPHLLQTPAAIRFISAEPLLGPVDLGAHIPAAFRRRDTLDWVVVGGESGNGARLCDTSFIRKIVSQCADAGVACFVKQLGARPEVPTPGGWNSAHREDLKLKDRKGGDMSEWPEDLRVRQFPKAAA